MSTDSDHWRIERIGAPGCQRAIPVPFYAALVALSVAGVAAVLFATTLGSAVPPDSVVYVDSARHLLSGQGLTVTTSGGSLSPLTHFPPLFPLILAGLGLLGLDPLDGARWLNAVVLGANVFLVGLAIRRFTRSNGMALFGALLALTSIDLNSVHVAAISEPLFILESVLALLLLDMYLEGRKRVVLVLAAAVIALSVLTRYAGGALVITGVGILLLGAGPDSPRGRERIREAVVFLTLACLPVLLWVVRNRLVADTLTNRTAAFHAITGKQLSVALSTFARWFARLPLASPLITPIGLIGAFFLVGLAAWVAARRWGRRQGSAAPGAATRFPLVFVGFPAAYAAFLFLSLSFFDAGTPLDGRILSPVFVSGLVVVLWLLHHLSPVVDGRHYLRATVVVIGLVVALSSVGADALWTLKTHRVGRGYSGRDWQQSQLIEKVRQLPASTSVYSNAGDAIFILTGRVVSGIPAKYDMTTQIPVENYQASMAAVKSELQREGGVVVYFSAVDWRPYQPTEEELQQAWNLTPMLKAPDGTVYAIESSR